MRTILKIPALVTILFCAIAVLNGCNSSPESYKPQTYTVVLSEMKFQPVELTVHRGDTVVWVNQDMVMHDVTEESHKVWSSGPLPAGKSWKMVADRSADYFCSIHVVMKGKLVVE